MSDLLPQPTSALSEQEDSMRNSQMDRRSITALDRIELEEERPKDYKGRIRVWPGALLLFVILAVSVGLITFFAMQTRDAALSRNQKQAIERQEKRKIKDGRSNETDAANITVVIEDIVDEDGVIGNPVQYPKTECTLPNYISEDGKFYAVGSDGSKTRMSIKGVNWFGMETSHAIPFGLWDNFQNGTTAVSIRISIVRILL